jgi:hypothetical protein
MSDPDKHGWTIATYAAHNEALRAAEEKFQAERDRRYEERDVANKAAVMAALASAERMAEKTEAALKEYKVGANEWRDTVKDLISGMQGGSKGMRDMWGWIIAAAMAGAVLFNIFGR